MADPVSPVGARNPATAVSAAGAINPEPVELDATPASTTEEVRLRRGSREDGGAEEREVCFAHTARGGGRKVEDIGVVVLTCGVCRSASSGFKSARATRRWWRRCRGRLGRRSLRRVWMLRAGWGVRGREGGRRDGMRILCAVGEEGGGGGIKA